MAMRGRVGSSLFGTLSRVLGDDVSVSSKSLRKMGQNTQGLNLGRRAKISAPTRAGGAGNLHTRAGTGRTFVSNDIYNQAHVIRRTKNGSWRSFRGNKLNNGYVR
jgi:hypothetical protein